MEKLIHTIESTPSWMKDSIFWDKVFEVADKFPEDLIRGKAPLIWKYLSDYHTIRTSVQKCKSPAFLKSLLCDCLVEDRSFFPTLAAEIPHNLGYVVFEILKENKDIALRIKNISNCGTILFLAGLIPYHKNSTDVDLISAYKWKNLFPWISQDTLETIIQNLNFVGKGTAIATLNHPLITGYNIFPEIIRMYLTEKIDSHRSYIEYKLESPLIEIDTHVVRNFNCELALRLIRCSINDGKPVRFSFTRNAASLISTILAPYLIASNELIDRYPEIKTFYSLYIKDQ